MYNYPIGMKKDVELTAKKEKLQYGEDLLKEWRISRNVLLQLQSFYWLRFLAGSSYGFVLPAFVLLSCYFEREVDLYSFSAIGSSELLIR